MKKFSTYILLSGLLFSLLISCQTATKNQQSQAIVHVEMNTDLGKISLILSNETPLHRDNFIKLANQGYFDGMLFHRIIENFGIQSGDPDSKNAKSGEALGNGGPGYTIPAEINTKLFHKRGALNAARDNNPDRASAGSQFFIVQGRIQTDSTLNKAEKRINGWLAENAYINAPEQKALKDSLILALKNDDEQSIIKWSDMIQINAKAYEDFKSYTIPQEHREVYKTIGGAPHLDQNYTVFGEVTEGMNIVDSIAAAQTDSLDRPLKDIKIISVKIVVN